MLKHCKGCFRLTSGVPPVQSDARGCTIGMPRTHGIAPRGDGSVETALGARLVLRPPLEHAYRSRPLRIRAQVARGRLPPPSAAIANVEDCDDGGVEVGRGRGSSARLERARVSKARRGVGVAVPCSARRSASTWRRGPRRAAADRASSPTRPIREGARHGRGYSRSPRATPAAGAASIERVAVGHLEAHVMLAARSVFARARLARDDCWARPGDARPAEEKQREIVRLSETVSPLTGATCSTTVLSSRARVLVAKAEDKMRCAASGEGVPVRGLRPSDQVSSNADATSLS